MQERVAESTETPLGKVALRTAPPNASRTSKNRARKLGVRRIDRKVMERQHLRRAIL